jgi:flagellar protein FlaG
MDIAPLQSTAPVAAPANVPDAQTAARNREVIQAVKAVNGAELFGSGSELSFSVDRSTQRPVIKVVDRKTGDIIQQIPPEYVLRMAQALDSDS